VDNRNPSPFSAILVIGSVNIDLVIQAERIPGPGENVMGSGFRTVPGGKGSNQAVAVSRMGGTARFCGCVGPDDFGRELLKSLAAAGVDTKLLRVSPEEGTGTAVIVVDEVTGESTIVVQRGANGRMTPDDVARAFEASPDAACVLLQLETTDEVVRAAVRGAVKRGIPAVVDAGPARGVPLSCFEGAAILSPNSFEAKALTGIEVVDSESAIRCAKRIRQAGVENCVFHMGERGAMIVDEKDAAIEVPAFVVKAVDTTAAGDSFMGALVVGMVEGMTLPEAVRMANAAGALACTKLGAQPSIPTRDEVNRMLSGK